MRTMHTPLRSFHTSSQQAIVSVAGRGLLLLLLLLLLLALGGPLGCVGSGHGSGAS
jgi:hypothetical protein